MDKIITNGIKIIFFICFFTSMHFAQNITSSNVKIKINLHKGISVMYSESNSEGEKIANNEKGARELLVSFNEISEKIVNSEMELFDKKIIFSVGSSLNQIIPNSGVYVAVDNVSYSDMLKFSSNFIHNTPTDFALNVIY